MTVQRLHETHKQQCPDGYTQFKKAIRDYQYVGRMVNVVWDSMTVEVYCGLDRITCHTMTDNMGYTTLDEHMPENHKAYQRSKEYNAAFNQIITLNLSTNEHTRDSVPT